VNARRVPTRSVWFGSVAGFAGILVAVRSPDRVFAFLLNASGALMLFIYLCTALAQLRLRQQREPAAQAALPLQMWLHPWGGLLAIAAMLTVLVAMALTPARRNEFYASVVALAVALAAAGLRARIGRTRSTPRGA
jgi:L-asparagine transporter-like permease